MRRRVFLGITLAWPLLAQTPAAQAPAPQNPSAAPTQEPLRNLPPPIKVTVNEVIVPVTVTDEKGRFVSDLDKTDFHIYEEGKEQQIQFFTRERSQPVVVGFLMDVSNASRLHWKNYLDAAIELVQNLVPGDNPKFSGYLIGYSNDAELLVNTTTDPEPMVEKMEKLKPSGGSALYDAIYMACTSRKLVQGEPIEPRRVLVIVGDGRAK
jgi:Ca-activated chloride channel family protein